MSKEKIDVLLEDGDDIQCGIEAKANHKDANFVEEKWHLSNGLELLLFGFCAQIFGIRAPKLTNIINVGILEIHLLSYVDRMEEDRIIICVIERIEKIRIVFLIK